MIASSPNVRPESAASSPRTPRPPMALLRRSRYWSGTVDVDRWANMAAARLLSHTFRSSSCVRLGWPLRESRSRRAPEACSLLKRRKRLARLVSPRRYSTIPGGHALTSQKLRSSEVSRSRRSAVPRTSSAPAAAPTREKRRSRTASEPPWRSACATRPAASIDAPDASSCALMCSSRRPADFSSAFCSSGKKTGAAPRAGPEERRLRGSIEPMLWATESAKRRCMSLRS